MLHKEAMAMSTSTSQFMALANFGTLYRPATAAYPLSPGLYVTCDRCRVTHLPACLHEGSLDLCLPCAHMLLAAQATGRASTDPCDHDVIRPMAARVYGTSHGGVLKSGGGSSDSDEDAGIPRVR
jgi:hypothetical protein